MTDDDIAPNEDLGAPPLRSKAEVAAGIASAAVASVPLVGGAAAELFELVIAPSLSKRRDEWMQKMGEAVEEIRERLQGFDPRHLEDNEEFVSTVLAASVVAVKSHQQEKLEMLRNALINAVLPGAPEQHEQMTYLRFVDELTPLHVRVLAFLSDPAQWFDDHGLEKPEFMAAGVSTILEVGLPELKDRRDLYDEVGRDLQQRGLAEPAFHVTMTNAGVWSPRSSPRGGRFLQFISLDGAGTPGAA